MREQVTMTGSFLAAGDLASYRVGDAVTLLRSPVPGAEAVTKLNNTSFFLGTIANVGPQRVVVNLTGIVLCRYVGSLWTGDSVYYFGDGAVKSASTRELGRGLVIEVLSGTEALVLL